MAVGNRTLAVRKPLLKQPQAKAHPTKEQGGQAKSRPKGDSKWQPKWRSGGQSNWGPLKWLPSLLQAQKWKSGWKKSPPTIPKDFELDKEARYTGVVQSYWKWKGYGFIQLADAGVVPNDKLYVSWQNIMSDDRYPSLMKDMQVEFGLMKWKVGRGKATLCAKGVSLPGGGMVAVQDESDAKKEFVGGQHLRYTGKLKTYSSRNKAGWVILDDGFQLDEDVEKELKVEEHEFNCGGKRPTRWGKDLEVEFGIVKNWKGQHRVYNMTLPGGLPITPESIDKREEVGSQTFAGTIQSWSGWKQWGFIEPDAVARLPKRVQAALTKANNAERASKPDKAIDNVLYFSKRDLAAGIRPQHGMAVTFQTYLDEKGVGAHNVTKAEE